LQAGELKFAMQVVTGEEMTEADAQALIQEVDTDGNNEIDPDEFIQLVRHGIA
jgi:Ca2+-binding EF-hand superfamily protein